MTEERARIHTRISLETQRKMETAMPRLQCSGFTSRTFFRLL